MAILRLVGQHILKPFNEYPLTKTFERRFIGVTILSTSALTLIGLAIFNLLTQGHDLVSSTVVLQTFYSPETPLKNGSSTTSCESSLLDVSASYFTRMPSTVHNNSGPDAEIDPGSFKWTINAFNPTGKLDAVQAAYNGEKLNCSIVSTGMTFYFSSNTYNYGICAKCKLVDRQNATYGGAAHITVLDVCTNYARNVDNWPSFTQKTQNRIEEYIVDLQSTYPNLTFALDDLPPEVYPEDFDPATSNITITPNLIDYVNVWFGDIRYRKNATTHECHNSIYCSKGSYFLWDKPGQVYDDLRLLFNLTSEGEIWSSGSVLPILGVGRIRPELAFNGDVSRLPGVLPDMYDIVYAVNGYLFDEAIRDLDGRSLATSFICNIQTSQWKSPLSLLAVVLGNSLSVFSVALTLMIAVGSIIEERYATNTSTVLPVTNDEEKPPGSPSSSYSQSSSVPAPFVRPFIPIPQARENDLEQAAPPGLCPPQTA